MDLNKLNAEWDKVKIHLLSDHSTVFLSSLVFSLELKWNEQIPTAQTNGLTIEWSPDFFLSLSKQERLGVTLHEALHVGYDHIGRMKMVNREDWEYFQQAADHSINLFLLENGFTLPSFRLADARYKGWATEAIFQDLKQAQSSTKRQMTCMVPDDAPSLPDGSKMSQDQITAQVQDILTRAAMQSSLSSDKPGSIPGEIELILKRLREPELPWTQIFMRKISSMDKGGYNYKRPRRRYVPEFLPERKGEKVEDLIAYVDISGSVSDEQFSMFIGELAGAMKFRKPKHIRLVQFNTQIMSSNTAKTINELKNIKFEGRGGTDVREVFDDISKQKKNKLCLIFTDGGFHWPDNYPKGHNIIWMINDNPSWKAKEGQVIHFSTEKYTNAKHNS